MNKQFWIFLFLFSFYLCKKKPIKSNFVSREANKTKIQHQLLFITNLTSFLHLNAFFLYQKIGYSNRIFRISKSSIDFLKTNRNSMRTLRENLSQFSEAKRWNGWDGLKPKKPKSETEKKIITKSNWKKWS